jgi:hypothetical protein
MKNYKTAFLITLTLSVLVISFLFADGIDSSIKQVRNSISISERSLDIQILAKIINEGNLSKAALLDILSANSSYKGRPSGASDTIRANTVAIVYDSNKVSKILVIE